MNTKFLKKSAAVFFAAVFTCAAFADKAEIKKETINIWPKGQMAGMDADKVSAKKTTETPRLSLYLPKTDKKTGFMIICPGGGYGGLASGHEGTEIAEWLADEEIPCAILHYRVPNMPNGALMDIQRAIKLVRSNAEKWNIDPNKIAIMGFSAGANLCARASTQFDTQTYTPVDAADSMSSRPDFTGLIYPAYCDKPGNDKRWKNKDLLPADTDYGTLYALAENLNITKNTPPAIIIQTQDDYYANAAIAYYLALKKNGVPANLFMFDRGGHGYGLHNKTDFVSEWKDLFEKWLELNRFDGEK